MWKNIVERGRPHGTIWRMRIACWIPTATNTHTGCVILIAFTLQQWLHERASMLCYTYIACLVLSVAQQLRSGLDRLIGQGFRSNTFRHTHTLQASDQLVADAASYTTYKYKRRTFTHLT